MSVERSETTTHPLPRGGTDLMSPLLSGNDLKVCPASKRNEADRIFDPPRAEKCFCLNYLAAAAFERAVKRDLYRAAAFLCNAPFCTALSMVEIVIGKSS
jgi:hypothetical protein